MKGGGMGRMWITFIVITACILITPAGTNSAEIHGFFEAGKDLDEQCGYMEVEISLNFDIWVIKNTIYGGWLTWAKLPDTTFGDVEYMLYDLYTIGYKIAYKQFYIKTEHWCRHPEELSGPDKAQSIIAIGIEW